MDDRKYFEAYDDRYQQVHAENLRWISAAPSAVVGEVLTKYGIGKLSRILEIGCGEGRDAAFLLKQGFQVLATDISSEAVCYCQKENPEFADCFRTLDCTGEVLMERFDCIYAVAVVHMLVLDADRRAFYRFVREHLTENGIGLICTMGDGEQEYSSDISTAFELQERFHQPTGRGIRIAGTSYRAVSFQTFGRELEESGFLILEEGITDMAPDYGSMMYAVVRRKSGEA